ncbi:MAG: hypothetical protein CMF73_03045 [Maricaulis sp.]|nr:hypothetical protein [Maricaulis sp.]
MTEQPMIPEKDTITEIDITPEMIEAAWGTLGPAMLCGDPFGAAQESLEDALNAALLRRGVLAGSGQN